MTLNLFSWFSQTQEERERERGSQIHHHQRGEIFTGRDEVKSLLMMMLYILTNLTSSSSTKSSGSRHASASGLQLLIPVMMTLHVLSPLQIQLKAADATRNIIKTGSKGWEIREWFFGYLIIIRLHLLFLFWIINWSSPPRDMFRRLWVKEPQGMIAWCGCSSWFALRHMVSSNMNMKKATRSSSGMV